MKLTFEKTFYSCLTVILCMRYAELHIERLQLESTSTINKAGNTANRVLCLGGQGQ